MVTTGTKHTELQQIVLRSIKKILVKELDYNKWANNYNTNYTTYVVPTESKKIKKLEWV